MVKEYVDHERGQAGQAPISTLTMYRNTPQPDWWPSGVPVSSPLCGCTIKRVAAWCFLGGVRRWLVRGWRLVAARHARGKVSKQLFQMPSVAAPLARSAHTATLSLGLCSGLPRLSKPRMCAPASTAPPAQCWPPSTTSDWSDVATGANLSFGSIYVCFCLLLFLRCFLSLSNSSVSSLQTSQPVKLE